MQRSAQLVRQAITESLDNEICAVATKRAPAEFLARCVVVDQLGRLGASDVLGRVVSVPTARAVTFVDRTGDAKLAAKEVVASRLGFGGKSHCAVDQVFVNEFVADEFLDTLAHELSSHEQAQSQKLVAAESNAQIQAAESGLASGSCKLVWRGQVGLAVEVEIGRAHV